MHCVKSWVQCTCQPSILDKINIKYHLQSVKYQPLKNDSLIFIYNYYMDTSTTHAQNREHVFKLIIYIYITTIILIEIPIDNVHRNTSSVDYKTIIYIYNN